MAKTTKIWISVLGGVLGCLICGAGELCAQQKMAPPQVQAELDRRAELLQQVVAASEKSARIELVEQVRESEKLLLQQEFPQHQLQMLLDEHIGLLTYLADHYELLEPEKVVTFREEILAARQRFYDEPDHWQIGMAKAQLAESKLIAKLPSEGLQRLNDAQVLYRKGDQEFSRQNYGLAARFQEECMTIYRKQLGESVSTAIAYRLYGRSLIEMQRGKEAADAMFHAAQIAHKTVGYSPLYSGALADCASGIYLAGDLKQAARLQQKAVQETERVYGKEHAEYASAINNWALYLSEIGNPEIAYQLAIEAGRIFSSLKGQEAALAENLNLTGTIAMAAQHQEEAYTLFLKAVRMQTELHGPEHFFVAVAYGNASIAAMKQGQMQRADLMMTRSLEIIDKTMGRDDPQAASTLIQMATVRRRQGRMKEAVPLVEQALASLKRAMGEDHPEYAKASLDLAVIYYETGKKKQSEEVIIHAAELFEEKLGPKSLWLSTALSHLAVVQSHGRDKEIAAQAIKLAGSILVSTIEKENPEYAEYLRRAATVYENAEQLGLAKSLLNELKEITQKKYGEQHPEYAMAISALGTVMLDTEEKDRGKVLLQESEKILVDVLGRTHPEVLQTMTKIARASRLAGDPAKAIDELVDIEALVKKQLGPENDVYSEILVEMGRSYLLEGDKQAAETALKKAASYYIEKRGQESPAAREALALIKIVRSGDQAQVNAEALRQLERHLPEVYDVMQKADQISKEINDPNAVEKRIANLMDRLILR